MTKIPNSFSDTEKYHISSDIFARQTRRDEAWNSKANAFIAKLVNNLQIAVTRMCKMEQRKYSSTMNYNSKLVFF